jgi:RNA polymerase sigma-70 factor (ECF subfamily)
MDAQTDEAIALRVQNGDLYAFKELVERYEPKMMRYARRFLFGYDDAQDAIQEVFIKAYRNIKSFDSSRRFSPWLYRVAHNEFINIIKKRGREPIAFFDPDTIFPHPVSAHPPDKEINEQELKQALEICLDKLDVKYREPLILYYFEDMDYKQISSIMHIPVATVGIRLRRGRSLLHELYLKTNSSL